MIAGERRKRPRAVFFCLSALLWECDSEDSSLHRVALSRNVRLFGFIFIIINFYDNRKYLIYLILDINIVIKNNIFK